MAKGKKIGFFGGSFDPFHLGHLNLVIEIKEKASLDEIWICPTFQSPFKIDAPPQDIDHRLEMVRQAIEGIPFLKVVDMEAKKKAICYTFDTLRALKSEGANLTLILADELVYDFERWRQAKDILKKFPCIVALRAHHQLNSSKIPDWVYRQIKNKIYPIRLLEISSREIRKRLKNKLCCKHLLPSKTLDYIYNYKLYS